MLNSNFIRPSTQRKHANIIFYQTAKGDHNSYRLKSKEVEIVDILYYNVHTYITAHSPSMHPATHREDPSLISTHTVV